MKRLLTAAVALVALAVTIPASASVAASASGHGTLSTPDGSRQFSFSAKLSDDGTATGNAVLHNPEFTGVNGNSPYMLQIDISCMKVIGDWAVFGGMTKRTNDPSLVDAVFFAVQDNGEPGKGLDEISLVFFWDDDPNTTGDPATCQFVTPTDFPLMTIESGNIQIRS
jgi:hypothetical protein